MAPFKIGVIVDSFRLPLREGLKKAKEIGAEGVQMYAVAGEMAPENLSADQRKELKSFIADLGLEISALVGDLGGHGLSVAEENVINIPRSKEIMDLAVDLGVPVVTTHIGVVPKDGPANPRYAVMQTACRELAEYGDSVGATFAIETGPETCADLKAFIDSLGARGVRVNLDPANLVMVTGDDPVAGTRALGDLIVHTHAKDGVMKKQTDPQIIYDFFAEGGIGDLRLSDYFLETPLGEGDVDFPGWLAALRDIGFDGFLTIEREVGDDPETDIRKAVAFLKELMAAM